MALDTNFNVNPYYDDFDEDKKFLRMLFRPGYAVQARELTQLQTILQKQVERFGNHIFKNGSVVTGGQTFLQDVTYFKLDSDYSGTAVDIDDFVGKTIVDNISIPTKRAEVVKVYDADTGTGDPKTLLVKVIYGTFSSGETILTYEDSGSFANISTSGTGTGQVFSVNEGVYYYDGFFVQNDAQTIATSKYSNSTANARIGFEITESLVTPASDTSLLDPAQDASNYQAPGADRYKIVLTLATRSLASTDDTQFIELARVENGTLTTFTQYPLYAVLEDTLARRTFDESGNYTVRPFKLSLDTNASNTAQTNVILSPGKAYVYGYEFETISPTIINVDKPREIESVQNKRITSDYGYFVYANNVYGSFPINSLATLDLHCVPNSSINLTSAGTASNTKIGTARVKSIAFDSAANTSNSASYEYKLYLFDIDVGSLSGQVANANTNYITIGNTVSGQVYSTVSNAYQGAKIRITSGPGVGETPRTITTYDGANQTILLSEPFVASVNNSSAWAIDFEFKDTESIVTTSGTNLVTGANIDERSKDLATTFQDTFISDSATEPLIFRLGEQYISQNTITDMSFSYKRLYASQIFSSSKSPALAQAIGESLAGATSTAAKAINYTISVTAPGTSPYAIGEIIAADKFTVDTGNSEITVVSGNNMTANIVATIDVSSATRKFKTYVAANSTIQTTGGVDVFGNSAVVTYGTQGQTHIAQDFVNKVPNEAQSLFISDAIELVSVLDYNGLAITTANTSSATDITSRFIFDNGQRDSFYDHSSIKLRPGVTGPTGPLLVRYNRFTSSGPGFFSVDSYGSIDYGRIPTYSSPTNNDAFYLRDCLDFRPVRADATAGSGTAVVFDVTPSTTGPKIPENGSDIILDHGYYLPRIDKVIVDKNRSFEVVKGVSSLTPVPPLDKTTGMTLYVLRNPAYVANTSEIQVEYVNNKRYTMRDIGTIEKRIENIEYYTALSLLEQDAISKQDLTILDSQNLPRFKNGIIVDSFDGHSVADVTDSDYVAAIDPLNKELRPSFNIDSYGLTFDSANSSNFTQSGPFVTANATSAITIEQPKASKAINVNPFNVINFLGKITLNPASDVWVDTQTKPDVLVNLGGDRDAWALITRAAFDYEWNSWQTVWTGTTTNTFRVQNNRSANWQQLNAGVGGQNDIVQHTVTSVNERQTRTGILSTVVPATITQSIGDRIVDVSIIPYMRSTNVLFVGSDFKPNTTLYPFFDATSVENFVANRVNKFTLTANNLTYKTTIANPEFVEIRNNATLTVNGTAIVVQTSNNQVIVTNVDPTTSFNIANAQLVGTTTGASYRISSYEHNGGVVQAATANTVTLRIDADGASNINSYNSSPIFIVQGTGAGQSATISSYNPATRVATITGTWATTPDTTSLYSIGRLRSDAAGQVAGIFTIPDGRFRIGEKLFRLMDSPVGDLPSSSTSGDASFFAQGLLQTTEEVIVSTTVPQIQRVNVNDERVVTVGTSTTRRVVWTDPLAQTFLISPIQYPEGLFLSKVRLCFRTKDDTVPVTLQIRPSVNGYPSSSVIYPYSTVSLTPDKVKITESPDIEDANKYTEFVFDAPVYLQPGEHSFVLLANSNKYETYVAEIGRLDLVTNRQISEQPYGGSLFLSQNGSTWTADQNSDMMFQLFRYTFNTNTVTADFLIQTPSSNTVYDLTHLITSDVTLPNTSLSYSFRSERSTGGLATFKPITPLTNYEMNDGDGRRVLNPTTGNTTFVLRASMRTSNPDISPFIDTTRMSMLAIENKINNLELSNDDIAISNTGSGYANSSDVVVTITGGGGSGATAAANVTSNVISSIFLTNAGSGYTTSPTITITPGSGGGSGAVATYIGENAKRGGNSDVRYITRRVTLADGFDSGDLRIYLTAYRPQGSNILVYGKLLSVSDPEIFDDKSWQLLTQLGNENYFSVNNSDFREFTYAPGTGGIPDNSISYVSGSTTYNQFRTFAIKIIMIGTNTTDVPRIRDLRVIALPAGA